MSTIEARLNDHEARLKKLEAKVFPTTPNPDPDNPPPSGAFTDKYGVIHAFRPKSINDIFYTVKRTLSGSDSIRDNIVTPVPLINCEVSAYLRPKSSPSNNGLQLKLRGGDHSNQSGRGDEGCCYIPAIRINSGIPHMRYECPHVPSPGNGYSRIPVTAIKSFGNLQNKWFGFRAVIYTTAEGNVHLLEWIDPPVTSMTTPMNKWVRTIDYVDRTIKQLKNKGPSFKTTFRLDDSALETKFASAYEIVAPAA